MHQRAATILLMLVVMTLAACASSGSGGSRQDARNSEKSSKAEAASVLVDLGLGYLQQGRVELARDNLQRAQKIDPNLPKVHTGLAIMWDSLGQPEDAERHYRRAVTLDPKYAPLHNNLGQFLCKTGRYEEAEKHFLIAVRDPFYSTPALALGNAGTCALRDNRSEDAERYLRQAIELEPAFGNALYQLAIIMRERGDDMRARAFLQRAESAGVVSPASLLLAYRVEQRLGDLRAAEQFKERLLREFRDSAEAQALKEVLQ